MCVLDGRSDAGSDGRAGGVGPVFVTAVALVTVAPGVAAMVFSGCSEALGDAPGAALEETLDGGALGCTGYGAAE